MKERRSQILKINPILVRFSKHKIYRSAEIDNTTPYLFWFILLISITDIINYNYTYDRDIVVHISIVV